MRFVKRILIIGHVNIGDVCYNLSVASPLRNSFPDAEISLATSSAMKDLFKGYPGIDNFIIFDKHGADRGFSGRLKFIKNIRKERFDLAVVLNSSLMYHFLGIPAIWRLKSRFCVTESGEDMHVVDAYQKLLGSHGIAVKEVVFNFGFTLQEKVSVQSFLKNSGISHSETVIGIAPMANWSLKCWPVENWNELIDDLAARRNFKVVVFGKAGNDPYSMKVASEISRKAVSAIDKFTLRETGALLERCRLFISSDSGLLHFASCLKVPCLGLFGPTGSKHYYPYSFRSGVAQSKADLSCMPCSRSRNFARCKAEGGSAPCMKFISPEEVLKSLEISLKQNC